MEQDSNFDAIAAEQQQLDILLDRGVFFTVEKRSILRFFGSKERRFVLKRFRLGTMDALSNEYIKTGYSVDHLKEDPFGESKRLVAQNAKRCARIIAIACLNSKWGIRLLTPFLADYLLWRLTPQKMLQLTRMINTMSDTPNFIGSIGLLSVTRRTTEPLPIETSPTSQASQPG